MSYNKLPVEVKRIVTDHIHQSDLKYRERVRVENLNKERFDDDDDWGYRLLTGMSVKLRGKGVHMWSRVNKECRQLCFTHLFRFLTLKVSKLSLPASQYSIANGPAVDAVTTLVCDDQATLEDLGLTFFHIVPRLKNLSHIEFKRRSAVFTLDFPRSGAADHLEFIKAQIVNLAKSIKSWTFHDSSNPRELQPIIAASQDNIHSISFTTPPTSLHTSESPSLLSFISTCPSISHLGVTFETTSPAAPGKTDCITNDALSWNYRFTNHLTSLTLNFDDCSSDFKVMSGMGWLDFSVLRFASLFPLLQRMDLTFARTDSLFPQSIPERILLPLQRLNISCRNFTAVSSVLHCLELPQIQHLHLGSLSDTDSTGQEPTENLRALPRIATRIHSMKDTLRLLLLSAKTVSLSAFLLDLERSLYQLETQAEIDYSASDEYNNLHSNHPYLIETEVFLIDELDEPVEQLRDLREAQLHRTVHNIEYITAWIRYRIGVVAEEGNLEEAREILKSLKDLDKYSEWLQD